MTVAEFPFSTLLRAPRTVTDRLASGDVVLHRRDGEDLYLSVRSRAERDAESVGEATRMLAALTRSPEGQRLVTSALRDAFPWMGFLTEHGRGQFVAEFIDTARACADVGTWAPFGQLLHEWKTTAALQADPDTHAALSGPLPDTDHGPVPAPEPDGDT